MLNSRAVRDRSETVSSPDGEASGTYDEYYTG